MGELHRPTEAEQQQYQPLVKEVLETQAATLEEAQRSTPRAMLGRHTISGFYGLSGAMIAMFRRDGDESKPGRPAVIGLC